MICWHTLAFDLLLSQATTTVVMICHIIITLCPMILVRFVAV